jgi:hypothetical protein
MCLLSIGYKETYGHLFYLTGLSLGEFNHLYLLTEDQQQRWRREHRKKLPVRASRMPNQYNKLREDGKKMVAGRVRELTYKSGMMGPGGGGLPARTSNNNKKSENRNKEKGCPRCGLETHQRVTNRLCPNDPSRLSDAQISVW